MNNIAVVIPSRGLVFSETIESIEENMHYNYPYRIFFSHNLPIPDSHNSVLHKAFMHSDHFDYFLIVEEDVVLPVGGVKALLELKTDIGFIDYGVNGYSCIAKRSNGEVLWCGTGATLIRRIVLKNLPYPWFRTDKQLRMNDWQWIPADTKNQYGGQDIRFGCDARAKGFLIKKVPHMEAKHLQLEVMGTKQTNHGCHLITQKPPIEHYQTIDPPDYI